MGPNVLLKRTLSGAFVASLRKLVLRNFNTMARWLIINGALLLFVSSLLGWLLLLPMQPWGKTLALILPRHWRAVHLDWLMLGLMQFAAALGVSTLGNPSLDLPVILLMIGGWLNVVPYIARAYGIDAFVLAGPPLRFSLALLSAASSASISVGWAWLLFEWL